MLNSAQVLFALAMGVWVVDVRFAPKPTAIEVGPEPISCQSGPSNAAPAEADLELVICAERGK